MNKVIFRNALAFFGAIAFAGATSMAVPIVYSVSDIGSGTLGASTFTNQLVTIQFAGDTSTAINSVGYIENLVGTGTVTIAGLGSATLTDAGINFFDNQNFSGTGYAGIAANGSILDTGADVFETYDGTTALPPTSGIAFYNQDQAFGTSAGSFILTSAGATSTFTATVPEPASLALAGLVGVGCLGARRRRA